MQVYLNIKNGKNNLIKFQDETRFKKKKLQLFEVFRFGKICWDAEKMDVSGIYLPLPPPYIYVFIIKNVCGHVKAYLSNIDGWIYIYFLKHVKP